MTSYYNIIYRKEYLIVHPLKFLYGMSRFNGITFLCLLLFATILWSCTKPTEPDKNALTFTIEDASCIETWLSFKRNGITGEVKISLYRNVGTHPDGNSLTAQFNLPENDTVFVDEGLLPNTIYNYEAVFTQGNITISKLKATAQTMDTTSSNFAWQTFTFGEHSSSVLYDVAIISPENIWCVGEIYMNDSLGNPDPRRYNAVHWDGEKWEVKRIPYIYEGQSFINPIQSVFAFNANDIWLCGNGVIQWDGNNFKPISIPATIWGPYQMNKIWGTSNNNLYIVGNDGNIAHYNGSSWRKIESGTDTDLKDICETPNGKELWICGWSNQTGRISVSAIKNNGVESLWDSQTNRELNTYSGTLVNSLWANGNGEFILIGGQVLRHSILDKRIVRREWVPIPNGQAVLQLGNYAYRIKGSNKNNIIAVGDAAMIWHYNGKSWLKFEEIYNLEDRLYGLAVTDNLIVSVGKSYDNGLFGGSLIIIGRR